jgi:hypothetical protein
LGAGFAVLGGGLRAAAAFVPHAPESLALEALYAVIDLSLLFGLMAIYTREAEALGWAGLVAFIASFAGLASIVGPDATMFGVNWYQVGATVSALGLAALGAVLLAAKRHPVAALCWIAVPIAAQVSVQCAGFVFGLGFTAAGVLGFIPPAAGKG